MLARSQLSEKMEKKMKVKRNYIIRKEYSNEVI